VTTLASPRTGRAHDNAGHRAGVFVNGLPLLVPVLEIPDAWC